MWDAGHLPSFFIERRIRAESKRLFLSLALPLFRAAFRHATPDQVGDGRIEEGGDITELALL
jgi:hypothetical protein